MTRTILFAFAVITFAMPMVCLAAEPVQTVPEPATGLLLLMGGAGAAAYRQMRKPRG
jgi:hypothetical protein